MSGWVAGAGLSVSEGSPGVSGFRPPTPATLASTYLTNIDSRTSSVTQEPHTYESVMSVMDTAKPSYCGETPG